MRTVAAVRKRRIYIRIEYYYIIATTVAQWNWTKKMRAASRRSVRRVSDGEHLKKK